MESSKYINLSGKIALNNKLLATNNNIANANTSGYNRDLPLSHSYRFQNMHFSNDIATILDRSVGAMQQTDNPFNLAISTPNNYFAITTQMGTRYTRDGNFYLHHSGMLVNKDGFFLLNDDGQSIIIISDTPTDIKIDQHGTIFNHNIAIDKIGVYTFHEPHLLRKEGQNLLSSAEEPLPAQDFRILQGMIEESNTSSITEMQDLINTSRHFEQATNFNNNTHKLSTDMLQVLLKAD